MATTLRTARSTTPVKVAATVTACLAVLAVGGPSILRARSRAERPIVTDAPANEVYGRLPAFFEPNVGQVDPSVRFLSRGAGHTVTLTDHEIVLGAPPARASGR